VKVTGRPLHYKTCFIPREVYGRPGFEYVVPLVTLEDPATGEYSGLVLSKGFIQFEWKDPSYRWRIENVDAQTFEGFVSDLRELKRTSIFQGNNPDTAHLNFTHSDTKDFAEATGFANKKQASVAMIERLEPGGPFDERDGAHYAHGASYQNQYPFAKTLAGALQLRKMPWDCAN
jgi:cytochrome oxidase assembly protein ShyY1